MKMKPKHKTLMRGKAPVPLPAEYIPRRLRGELGTLLIAEWQIEHRVKELAARLEKDFAKKDLVVVSLLNGTVLFLGDLIRHLNLPMHLDFMGVSSYRDGTKSRELVYTKDLRIDVKGRDVLLVDDILDTGKTLSDVTRKLKDLKPREIRTCVLLDKAARRTEDIQADYVGFEIDDLFVVGYGLDYAERYRNLPFVGDLKPELFQDQD
jgi:hypoxanthine phosphoribosyltransferase